MLREAEHMNKYYLALGTDNQVVSIDGTMVSLKSNQYIVAPQSSIVLCNNLHTISGLLSCYPYAIHTDNGDITTLISIKEKHQNLATISGISIAITGIISSKDKHYSPIINQIKLDIEEHFQLHDYAPIQYIRLLPFSYHYLRKLFAKEVGLSPTAYLIELRLNYAKQLLLTTNHTITTIANMCGYADSLYFSRLYSKHYGISPTTERQQ